MLDGDIHEMRMDNQVPRRAGWPRVACVVRASSRLSLHFLNFFPSASPAGDRVAPSRRLSGRSS